KRNASTGFDEGGKLACRCSFGRRSRSMMRASRGPIKETEWVTSVQGAVHLTLFKRVAPPHRDNAPRCRVGYHRRVVDRVPIGRSAGDISRPGDAFLNRVLHHGRSYAAFLHRVE